MVSTLPQSGESNVIYLVPKNPAGAAGNIYDEYVWTGSDFELIGDTDIDLSNYYSKSDVDSLLLTKQNKLTAGSNITIAANGTISAADPGVTGVKGQQESTYRTGNVNITPANLLLLGNNITGGTSNDTRDFWVNKGTGYAYFNAANMLNGQPSQYGILENVNNGVYGTQTFRTADGRVFVRGYSGASNTMGSWVQLAPTDSPAFTGTPTAPTNSTASTSNTQIATTAFVQNAIKRRVPTALFSSSKNPLPTENYVTLPDKFPGTGTFIGYFNINFGSAQANYSYSAYVGIATTAVPNGSSSAPAGWTTKAYQRQITGGSSVAGNIYFSIPVVLRVNNTMYPCIYRGQSSALSSTDLANCTGIIIYD